MKYELKPEFDSRKSFYRKAKVIKENNKLVLRSYNTRVAEIDLKENKAIIFKISSQTTLRHIKEFLKQNSFKAETKKQILKDYKKGVGKNEI